MRTRKTVNPSEFWQYSANRIEFLVVFCVFTLLFILTRSVSLDEFDSINLALGVKEFNLSLHQPHAPGAPIYIFLGKVLHSMDIPVKDALQFIEAAGGGLFVAASFWLVSMFYGRSAGYWLATLLAMTPGVWMTATKVMSDALSAGLTVLAVLFLCKAQDRFRKRPGYLILFALVLAAGIGVRPPLAPMLVILLLVALFSPIPIKHKIYAVAAFAIGNLCWLIPTIISQANLDANPNGWMNFFVQLQEFKTHSTSMATWHFDYSNWTFIYAVKRLLLHLGGMLYFGMGFSLWYPESVNQILGRLGTELTPWNTQIEEWSLGGSIFLLIFTIAILRFFIHVFQWRIRLFGSLPLFGDYCIFCIYISQCPRL